METTDAACTTALGNASSTTVGMTFKLHHVWQAVGSAELSVANVGIANAALSHGLQASMSD